MARPWIRWLSRIVIAVVVVAVVSVEYCCGGLVAVFAGGDAMGPVGQSCRSSLCHCYFVTSMS